MSNFNDIPLPTDCWYSIVSSHVDKLPTSRTCRESSLFHLNKQLRLCGVNSWCQVISRDSNNWSRNQLIAADGTCVLCVHNARCTMASRDEFSSLFLAGFFSHTIFNFPWYGQLITKLCYFLANILFVWALYTVKWHATMRKLMHTT